MHDISDFQEPFQESCYAQLPQTSVLAIAVQNLTLASDFYVQLLDLLVSKYPSTTNNPFLID